MKVAIFGLDEMALTAMKHLWCCDMAFGAVEMP